MNQMNQINQNNNTHKMGKNNHNTKIIIAFVAGLIIGSLITPIVASDKLNSISDKKDSDKKEISNSNNSVTVKDQLAGDRVILDNITLSESGWAAVHEDVNGDLGNVLGAQLFDAGSNSGYIDLLRNTETGHKYYIILYKDNNDREFDLKTDIAFVNELEEVVSSTFETIMFDKKNN